MVVVLFSSKKWHCCKSFFTLLQEKTCLFHVMWLISKSNISSACMCVCVFHRSIIISRCRFQSSRIVSIMQRVRQSFIDMMIPFPYLTLPYLGLLRLVHLSQPSLIHWWMVGWWWGWDLRTLSGAPWPKGWKNQSQYAHLTDWQGEISFWSGWFVDDNFYTFI